MSTVRAGRAPALYQRGLLADAERSRALEEVSKLQAIYPRRLRSALDARLHGRKVYPELKANVKKQNCPEGRKNEPCRVKARVCRSRIYVSNAAAENRPDDAEY